MIAHHTAGGCNLRPGDMLATGTLSCGGTQGAGCLQEATWGGTQPIQLKDGSQRTFLLDGDTGAPLCLLCAAPACRRCTVA